MFYGEILAKRAKTLEARKKITGFQTGSGQTGFYRSAIDSHNNAIIMP